MNLLRELVVPSAFMLVAWLCSYLLRSRLSLRKDRSDVRLKMDGEEVGLPVASDRDTLQTRLDLLARISPGLAVLDGWQIIERAILARVPALEGGDAVRGSDVLAIAQDLPGMTDATMDRLKRVRRFRNLVVHAADLSGQEEVLHAVLEDLVSVVAALDPRFDTRQASA